jgi:hypothetical protein
LRQDKSFFLVLANPGGSLHLVYLVPSSYPKGKSFAGQTLIASCHLMGNPTDRSKLVTSKSIDTSIKLSLWIISLPFEINWTKRVSTSKAVLNVKKRRRRRRNV